MSVSIDHGLPVYNMKLKMHRPSSARVYTGSVGNSHKSIFDKLKGEQYPKPKFVTFCEFSPSPRRKNNTFYMCLTRNEISELNIRVFVSLNL